MMQRSQILFEPEQWNEVVVLAKSQEISISQLIRKFVDEGISTEIKQKKKILSQKERILNTLMSRKSLSNSKGDVSVNVDHYLYGAIKK